MRFPAGFVAALAVALGLFWLMHWLIAAPHGRAEPPPKQAKITIVQMPKQPDPQQSKSNSGGGGSPAAPKPPPVPGLSRPSGLEIPVPKTDTDVVMPALDFNPQLSNFGGMGQAFAGYAGGGQGGGVGGGFGTGFGPGSGRGGGGGPDLVPLSTARPQIPERACELGIEGWAAVTFTVTPRGKVTNIKIIGADPRGLFERPMVESVKDWLYQSNDEGKAYRVSWKFEFKLEDCQLNWDVGG